MWSCLAWAMADPAPRDGHPPQPSGGWWRIFPRQENVRSVLISKVNQFHLLKCVHIHLHG